MAYRDQRMRRTGPVQALSDVTLAIEPGEKVGLIGDNGAGKSTLLRVMAGILRPNGGTVETNGRRASLLSLTAGFDMDLSGGRNVVLHGMLTGLAPKEAAARVANVATSAGLGEAIHRRVSTYSTGMQARLRFWTAMSLDTDLMLIDEVLSVGDREFRERSRTAIEELLRGDRTVVLASHNLSFVNSVCDRVIWLDGGRVRMDDAAKLVIGEYQALAAHRSPAPARRTESRARRPLFVCGAPRSGTTAVTRLLNTHPDIVLGIERFKTRLLLADDGEDLKGLFARERFFDYRPGDTNIDYRRSYRGDMARAAGKFDEAVYVGDKVPNLYKRFGFFAERLPDCRFVFMLRNPLHVALSWQARALDETDAWPAKNDYRQAVADWNESVRTALGARRHIGTRIAVVSYDRIFGTRGWGVWRELMRRLELSPSANSLTRSYMRTAKRRGQATRDAPTDLREYVERHADREAYAELLVEAL